MSEVHIITRKDIWTEMQKVAVSGPSDTPLYYWCTEVQWNHREWREMFKRNFPGITLRCVKHK